MKTAKRYVLLMAEAGLSESERRELHSVIERRYGKVKMIEVEENPRAVIVKTTNLAAPLLRNPEGGLTVGGKKLAAVLTSGAVGNLKRRARQAGAIGKIPQ